MLADTERQDRSKQLRKARKKRYEKRLKDNRPFIAYDGEGITLDDGSHIYTLLASSDGRYIENYNGLSARDCLDFLLEGKRAHPTGIHVIYGGTYDMNMILRELPEKYLRNLWTVGFTRWADYRIRYRHRKEYAVAYADTTITLYDVQTFFQTTFVRACDEYLGEYVGRQTVVDGKAKRGQFTISDRETTREYCFAELQLLVLLMDELRTRLYRVDLRPTRWNGPGAVATALMQREGVKQYLAPTSPERINATRCAYFGGRFEVAQFGHYEGDVWEYDINSAYPAAMRYLPSLADGDWIHRGPSHEVSDDFSLVHCNYNLPRIPGETTHLLGPAPSRAKGGTISYPSGGGIWLWGIEAKGVQEWCKRKKGTFTVDEWWQFKPATDYKPFGFVEPLYEQRRALKAAGDGAHVGVKLGINSLYGKTAQQVGWTKDSFNRPRLPPYHQLDYAGYITASCRAQIWKAYMLNPEAIVAIETDAIFSTEPLPLKIGTGLGEWEVTKFTDLTYVQSGTYWGTLESGKEVQKYRGFDRGTISRQDLLSKWREPEWWTGIAGMETRFGAMGEALHRGSWDTFCRWNTNPRMLSTELSGKRSHIGPECKACLGDREVRLPGMGLQGFPLGVWHESQCLKDFYPSESLPCTIEWLDTLDDEYDIEAEFSRRNQIDWD